MLLWALPSHMDACTAAHHGYIIEILHEIGQSKLHLNLLKSTLQNEYQIEFETLSVS